jgi:hypothetical protein
MAPTAKPIIAFAAIQLKLIPYLLKNSELKSATPVAKAAPIIAPYA